MGLGWQNGIALEMKGVSVYSGREVTGEPVIQLEQVSAALELVPLLQGNIQLGSIVLDRPQVHVIRTPQGTIRVLGLNLQSGAVKKSSPYGLLIHDVRLQDGILRFTDNQTQPPLDLIATDIDLALQNVSWTGKEFGGEVRLKDAKVSLDGIGTIERISFVARGNRNEIEVSELSGNLMKGTLKGSATVDDLARTPRLDFHFSAESLHLGGLQPSVRASQAQLVGLLTASFEGKAVLPQLEATMTGQGRVSVSDGAIMNFNLLREVFSRLSLIPGLVSRLESRLPEEYRVRLDAPHTALHPVDAYGQIRQGRIYFDLDVATDDFELTMKGSVDFNRTIEAHGMLAVHPYLSEAFVRSVNELEALRAPEGFLLIPVLISGSFDKLSFLPDFKSIATRLAMAKTSELLSDLLA